MRHPDLFAAFLDRTVNLNSTRLKRLEEKVALVEAQLKSTEYKPKILSVSIQGSYAHRTIIKPPRSTKSFDADMTVYIEERSGWTAKDYIERLYVRVKEIPHYNKIVKLQSRCVTIDYADDFHLDVVPITVRRPFLGSKSYRVCNRTSDCFEPTDGPAFDRWWADKGEILGDEQLVEVTRALKYLRDIKGRFSCKSILLTALIGELVVDDDRGGFADVPTALMEIIGRLDDSLSSHSRMPIITNPVLPSENFNRHWDDTKFIIFRNNISRYREWVDDAFHEKDPKESIVKWRRLFGNEFAKGIDLEDLPFIATNALETNDERSPDNTGLLFVLAGAALAMLLKG